ncbi:MAG: cellulase family glycosylhydrolase, partial [Bacteroidales bacterium]|nr:cellulase family glycosylhydrolase [Bacteroidales bacterium]
QQLLVLILLVVFSFNNLTAQITPQEAVVEMGRGINLGNTLDAPNEGEWAPAAEEYYFDMYKDAGFKTVRVPITWDNHLGTSLPYTIDSAFFARVDTIINWGLERDFFVIINAHHDAWIKEDYEANKDRFDSLWVQVADKFKDKSEKLLFEIINEPHGAITVAQVDELNARVHGIIRENNPTRIVLYGGASWSNSAHLLEAAIPDTNDPYLMGYYHSYDPWDFAGEGNGTWGTTSDKNAMINQMAQIEEWSIENNIPVLIGEFGARTKCDYNSRMIYYATYTEQALAHGMAFTVWDDNGWFQVLERVDSTWNDAKDILIYTTPQSPTDIEAQLVDENEVSISWTNRAADCNTLLLERRVNNSDFVLFAELIATIADYADFDVEIGNSYTYRVIARYNDSIDLYSYPAKVRVIEDASGIIEVQSIAGIVFPNPAKETLFLKDTDFSQDTPVAIISISGTTVHTAIISQLQKGLDISQLPKGVYFIRIQNNKSIKQTRFLKI